MKEKLKSYSFWVKIISVLIIIANIITSKFGYSIDSALIFDIATIVATLFVVLGVITEPTGINNKNDYCEVNGVMEQIKKDLALEVENIVSCIENNDAGLLNEILDRIKLKLETIKGESKFDVNLENESEIKNEDVSEEEAVEEALKEEETVEDALKEGETVEVNHNNDLIKENNFEEVAMPLEVVVGEEEDSHEEAIVDESEKGASEEITKEAKEESVSYVEINGEKYVAKIVDGRALLEKI